MWSDTQHFKYTSYYSRSLNIYIYMKPSYDQQRSNKEAKCE